MLWNALRTGDFRTALIYLALSLPAVILCLSVHEAAHGGVASLLGDRTAKAAGRVTLSPMAHIDPLGLLCLIVFGFGWARPVPVNISNFKNRRFGMAATALAGPISNLLVAFVFYCLYLFFGSVELGALQVAVLLFCRIVASMSVGLGVFNLIPVHPLDGSRVLDAFLPFSWSQKLQKYQPIILLVFIAALWFGWLNAIIGRVDSVLINLAWNVMRHLIG